MVFRIVGQITLRRKHLDFSPAEHVVDPLDREDRSSSSDAVIFQVKLMLLPQMTHTRGQRVSTSRKFVEKAMSNDPKNGSWVRAPTALSR